MGKIDDERNLRLAFSEVFLGEAARFPHGKASGQLVAGLHRLRQAGVAEPD